MVNSHAMLGWTSWLVGWLTPTSYVVLVVINSHAVEGWTSGLNGLFARGLRLDRLVAWLDCKVLCSFGSD